MDIYKYYIPRECNISLFPVSDLIFLISVHRLSDEVEVVKLKRVLGGDTLSNAACSHFFPFQRSFFKVSYLSLDQDGINIPLRLPKPYKGFFLTIAPGPLFS